MAYTALEQAILYEYYMRKAWNPLEGLFDRQLAVINDPSRRKCLYTSRRAGKTYLALRYLVHVAQNQPGTIVGYLTKTRQWAKELLWTELHKLDQDHHLRIDFNNSELTAVFPNGSTLKLAGASDLQEADKLRGFAYSLLILDEIQAVPDKVMKYVVKEILPAALGDYAGTLLVSGTPPESCAGYFYDAATNPDMKFSRHHWTVAENPMFPQWSEEEEWEDLVQDWLAQEREDHNLKETDPAYLREYLGQFVKEASRFIYDLQDVNKLDPKKVPSDLVLVMGIDSGWHDETAFVIVGYEPYDQKVYHVESISKPHMTYYKIEQQVHELIEKYQPQGGIETIVYDPAGEGKTIGESLTEALTERFDLTIEFAQKQQKRNFMLLLKSDMRAGRALVQYPSKLWDQLQALQWNDARTREREGQPCDEADAFLYAWKNCYQFLKENRPETKPEEMNPVDWQAELERREYFEELKRQKEDEEYAGLEEDTYDSW